MLGTVLRLVGLATLIGSVCLPGASPVRAEGSPGAEIPGLVAYWSMDADRIEGSLVHDQSGNGHDGILVGALPATSPRGGALSFVTGNPQYVIVPSDSDLDLDGDFTIMAWVYLHNFGQSYRGALVSRLDLDDAAGWSLHVSDEFNNDGLLFYGVTEQSGIYSTNGVMHLHQWQHVVVRHAAGVTTFLVDGVPAGQQTVLHAPRASAAALYIGNASALASGFRGLIDELRIYDRALTNDEVNALRTGTTACAIHLEVVYDAVSWQSDDTVVFDLIRGDLGPLLAHGGDFGASPVSCLADSTSSTSWGVTESPATPGAGHWYLVSGAGGWGTCSADSMGPGQIRGRDALLDQSLGVCP